MYELFHLYDVIMYEYFSVTPVGIHLGGVILNFHDENR
jgi:hypothetical protein